MALKAAMKKGQPHFKKRLFGNLFNQLLVTENGIKVFYELEEQSNLNGSERQKKKPSDSKSDGISIFTKSLFSQPLGFFVSNGSPVVTVGGRGLMLDEPITPVSYVSVFIPHFIGKPSENQAILRKLYLGFDLSSYQISDLTGWSRTAISDYLRKAKINKDSIKSPSPRYGEREVSGVRIPHQAEQKVIQKIVSLKSKGHSFREIARVLTESGIPSKRGGQWSKTTVQEIYKREQEKKK